MSAPPLLPPPPPLSTIEATWGPYVTGIMMQQLFMGVFVVQVYDYFRLFPRDPTYIKAFVATLTIVTVLQAVMDYLTLYRCAVTYYGNFDKFDDTDWSLWWEIAVTAIVGSIAQAFFLLRCWSATRSKIVVAVGCCAIVLSLVAGVVSTVKFQQIKRLSYVVHYLLAVPSIPVPITIWLVATAIIDVSIAVVLVVSLLRAKTPFRKTEAIITRLVRLTMETSALTATIAVINLVLYLALPGLAYHLLPQLIMGKMYAISAMVTLGSRKGLREILEESDHASFITSSIHPQTNLKPTSSGIKVTRTTTVGEPNADIELGDRKNVNLDASEDDAVSSYDDRKRRF